MLLGSVILCVCAAVCAILYIAMGIWALRRSTPMHFWSGSKVPPEEIRDIPAYNRANGIMWLAYGALWVPIAFLAFASVAGAGIAMAAMGLVGLPALVLTYRHIYNQYKA